MGVIEVLKRQERQAGAEEKSRDVVTNLLLADKFTVSEIANFASVEEAFVLKVKAQLAKQKK